MGALLGLSRWIDRLNKGVNGIALWLVLLCTLVSAGNAVFRYAFNLSSNAWLELQWFMFAAIFLLGAAYTLKENGHVRVDVMYGRYSPRTQVWVDLLGGLLFLIPTCLVVLITSIPWALNSIRIFEMSSDAGGLPFWIIKPILPIAMALLLLQGISEVIKRIAMLSGHLEMPKYVSEVEAELIEAKETVGEVVEQRQKESP